MSKNVITVAVSGGTAVGKSAIAQVIASALANVGISIVYHDHGMDGNPRRSDAKAVEICEHIGPNTMVDVQEINLGRGPTGYIESAEQRLMQKIVSSVSGRINSR